MNATRDFDESLLPIPCAETAYPPGECQPVACPGREGDLRDPLVPRFHRQPAGLPL